MSGLSGRLDPAIPGQTGRSPRQDYSSKGLALSGAPGPRLGAGAGLSNTTGMSPRSRSASVWLGVLAMLAQLWLPSWHAAAYAQANDNPLAYAWCGTGAVETAARLREQLAPEIVEALTQDASALTLADCALCALVHGVGGAGPTSVMPALAPAPATRLPLPVVDAPVLQWRDHPPSRGPPPTLA